LLEVSLSVLTNRTAIVTGSTSGIGMGIARSLAAAGCSIVLNGMGDRVDIERQRVELAQTYGVKVFYNPADISLPQNCSDLITDTVAHFGSVDVLVNNAGIQHIAPIESFPMDRWDAVLALNLSAPFHTIRAVLPYMRSCGWGRIINIASTHGLVASPGKAAYVAAKHGLVGLTKVVALETAALSGITCNAICPGFVDTPLVQQQIKANALAEGVDLADAGQKFLLEKHPTGAFTTVSQIGALVEFLCSDAAANLTGAAIPIDGGWVAQ